MNSTTRVTPRFVVLYVLVALGMISLSKLAFYELTGAARALRAAVGQEIRLPDTEVRAVGSPLRQPRGGTLTAVQYRWNDTLGFFDLRVDYTQGSTRVSPREAMTLEIIDTHTSSGTPH